MRERQGDRELEQAEHKDSSPGCPPLASRKEPLLHPWAGETARGTLTRGVGGPLAVKSAPPPANPPYQHPAKSRHPASSELLVPQKHLFGLCHRRQADGGPTQDSFVGRRAKCSPRSPGRSAHRRAWVSPAPEKAASLSPGRGSRREGLHYLWIKPNLWARSTPYIPLPRFMPCLSSFEPNFQDIANAWNFPYTPHISHTCPCNTPYPAYNVLLHLFSWRTPIMLSKPCSEGPSSVKPRTPKTNHSLPYTCAGPWTDFS